MSVPAQKQLKYTAGIANGSVRESASFMDQTRKVFPAWIRLISVGCSLWPSNLWDILCADDTNWTIVDEEITSCRARWEAMEVEEKSSPVAVAVQMEMAETLETLRVD